MFAMSLVESTDYSISYGILFCDNDEISENDIQQKIYEIRDKIIKNGKDEWLLEDIIKDFPEEWKIWIQENNETIEI